jgi:hypothetical protein
MLRTSPSRSLSAALPTLALAASLLVSSPAQAQLSAGGGIASDVLYYDVLATDGSKQWLGQVVVVGADAKDLPVGFAPGTETWMLLDTSLPASFALAPVAGDLPDTLLVPHGILPDTIMKGSPTFAPGEELSVAVDALLPAALRKPAQILPDTIMAPGLTVVSDHLRFGESVTLGGGWSVPTTAQAYTATAAPCADCTGDTLAWFLLHDDGKQQAWADAALVDTETLELDPGEVLRFDAGGLPAAGTVKVLTAE